ncbi:MAG: cellulose biosynthesis protein BcsN [Rhodospirillaceae bacterium]
MIKRQASPQGLGAFASLVVLLAGLVLLSACAPRSTWPGRTSHFDRSHEWVEVDPSRSLVLFNSAASPRVVAVRERNINDLLFVQELVFENNSYISGENKLTLAVMFDAPVTWLVANGIAFNDANRYLTQYGGRPSAELLTTAFAGQSHQISDFLHQNQYGVFGHAHTTPRSETQCAVSWQRIEDQGAVLPNNLRSVDLRFRFCDRAVGEPQIREIFRGLTLNAATGIFGRPDPVGPGGAVAGAAPGSTWSSPPLQVPGQVPGQAPGLPLAPGGQLPLTNQPYTQGPPQLQTPLPTPAPEPSTVPQSVTNVSLPYPYTITPPQRQQPFSPTRPSAFAPPSVLYSSPAGSLGLPNLEPVQAVSGVANGPILTIPRAVRPSGMSALPQ